MTDCKELAVRQAGPDKATQELFEKHSKETIAVKWNGGRIRVSTEPRRRHREDDGQDGLQERDN